MNKINLNEITSFLKILFSLLGIIIFLLGLTLCVVPGQSYAKQLFLSTTFYLIGTLFLLWIAFPLRSIPKFQISSYINFPSLLLTGSAIALTATIFLVNPPCLRLHTDEGFLLGTSQSFYTEQTISIPVEAILSNGKISVIHTSSPTRPLLFPFLTNLLHRCRGYNLQNAFILNFIGLALLLFLAGVFIAKYWSVLAGLALQFAIVSHPIIWHRASSGLADLINALFFFISALSLRQYLRVPSAQSLTLLTLSLCLLANIRYESAIFLLLTIGFLLLFRKISWAHIQSSLPTLTIIALCCLPLFWQRFIFIEKTTYYNPTILSLTPKYLIENLLSLSKTLLSLPPNILYYFSPFLTLGVLALILFAIKIIKNNKKFLLSNEGIFFLWLMICLMVHVLLMCSFPGAIATRYLTAHYFMIEAVFLSALGVIFLFSFASNTFMRTCLCITFLLVFISQLPLVANLQKAQIKTCHQTLYYQAVSDMIRDFNSEQSLLVIDYPMEYILRGWAAIYPKTFNVDYPSIKKAWNAHEYHAIYYIKRSQKKDAAPELNKEWTAKLIQTSKINKDSFVSLYTLEPKERPAPRR